MDKTTAENRLKDQENNACASYSVEKSLPDQWYLANRFSDGHKLYLWPDNQVHKTMHTWPTESKARLRLDKYITMLCDAAGQQAKPDSECRYDYNRGLERAATGLELEADQFKEMATSFVNRGLTDQCSEANQRASYATFLAEQVRCLKL